MSINIRVKLQDVDEDSAFQYGVTVLDVGIKSVDEDSAYQYGGDSIGCGHKECG